MTTPPHGSEPPQPHAEQTPQPYGAIPGQVHFPQTPPDVVQFAMGSEVSDTAAALEVKPWKLLRIAAPVGTLAVAGWCAVELSWVSGVVALILLLPLVLWAVLWSSRARVRLDVNGLHLRGLLGERSYPYPALDQPVLLKQGARPRLLCLRLANGTNAAALQAGMWGLTGITAIASRLGALEIGHLSRAQINAAFPGMLPWRERHPVLHNMMALLLLIGGFVLVVVVSGIVA